MRISEDEKNLVRKIALEFTWVDDRITQGPEEHWKIHKTIPFKGDCDDFALTCLYFLQGKSKISFYHALITKKARIHHCNLNEGHMVLEYKGHYVDEANYFVTQASLIQNGYKFSKNRTYKSYQVYAMITISKLLDVLPSLMKSNKVGKLWIYTTQQSIRMLSPVGWVFETFLGIIVVFLWNLLCLIYTILVPALMFWMIYILFRFFTEIV